MAFTEVLCLQAAWKLVCRPGKSEGGPAERWRGREEAYPFSILATEQWKKETRTREAKRGLWELVS